MSWQRSVLLDQRSRTAVLSRFYHYYTPVFNVSNEPLDWIEKEVIEKFSEPEEELLFFDLAKVIDRVLQKWFSFEERVPIRPIRNEDLILNTEKLTVEEEVQKIEDLINYVI